nr:ATP-binding cassette domain-containing protein [Angustibacter aerolatus]
MQDVAGTSAQTTEAPAHLDPPRGPGSRPLDWRRLRGPVATTALVAAGLAGLGQALGTVFAGRLADQATVFLVWVLAASVVGSALLDTAGRTFWSVAVDRAEGALRTDLLDAVMHQPLAELGEQAVGEVLDRVDDDTHEPARCCGRTPGRSCGWPWAHRRCSSSPASPGGRPGCCCRSRRSACCSPSGRCWRRRPSARCSRRWPGPTTRPPWRRASPPATTCARASARGSCCAASPSLSALVHRRFAEVVVLESRISRRAGVLLHGLLAAVAVVGVLLVLSGHESTAALVTLFLVTTTFVGQVDQVARHVPDLQAGVGALTRLRALLATEREPEGGLPVPLGVPSVEVRGLHFAYPDGDFALRDVDLLVPAGTTLALVGRSGSGKSTLASLLSRAVEPPVGTVLLGGVDVRDLDLEQAAQRRRGGHPAHRDPGRHARRERRDVRRPRTRPGPGRGRRASASPTG